MRHMRLWLSPSAFSQVPAGLAPESSFTALSGDTSRVKIGFHWACRLFTSLRSGLDVDNESQIITHTGRTEWRRSRTQGRGYNHGNSEHSIGGWEAPSAPVLQHQERKRVLREARPWFLGSSSDLWQKESGLSDCRVIMWRVVVAMEQRDPTYHAFGPGYSTNKDGGRE